MPRPLKSGLDYFPLDVNFFSDPKIKILKARYGTDGIAIYTYLLCEVYDNGFYIKVDDDYMYIISDDLNLKPDLVKQVLTFLLERSLFDNTLFQSDAVLTSAGIQKRYQLAVKERAKKRPIEIKGYWLLNEENTEPFIKVNHFGDKSGKNKDKSGNKDIVSRDVSLKESKVKKSKRNKTICPEPSNEAAGPVLFKLILNDGSNHSVYQEEVDKYTALYPAVDVEQEYRKMIGWLDSHPKNRKTKSGIGKFVTGWLGRAQDSARPTGQVKQKGNAFHNFEQRDTDYGSLVLDQVKSWIGSEQEGG